MEKENRSILLVLTMALVLTGCSFRIETEPEKANVTINDKEYQTPLTLKQFRPSISGTISQEGYEPVNFKQWFYEKGTYELQPLYHSLSIEVEPEVEYVFLNEKKITDRVLTLQEGAYTLAIYPDSHYRNHSEQFYLDKQTELKIYLEKTFLTFTYRAHEKIEDLKIDDNQIESYGAKDIEFRLESKDSYTFSFVLNGKTYSRELEYGTIAGKADYFSKRMQIEYEILSWLEDPSHSLYTAYNLDNKMVAEIPEFSYRYDPEYIAVKSENFEPVREPMGRHLKENGPITGVYLGEFVKDIEDQNQIDYVPNWGMILYNFDFTNPDLRMDMESDKGDFSSTSLYNLRESVLTSDTDESISYLLFYDTPGHRPPRHEASWTFRIYDDSELLKEYHHPAKYRTGDLCIYHYDPRISSSAVDYSTPERWVFFPEWGSERFLFVHRNISENFYAPIAIYRVPPKAGLFEFQILEPGQYNIEISSSLKYEERQFMLGNVRTLYRGK